MIIDALIDSNVIIAALTGNHEHHAHTAGLFDIATNPTFAVSAHSYAEAYNTLTRRGPNAPFCFSPEEAWAALESLRAITQLVGLTPAQSFETVRSYATQGGIGPRLYDRMIGEAAVIHGIPTIVTWNVSHMRSLFPKIDVATPSEFAQRP